MDLANTKSVIITQIREMVSQCDLTLKAVSCSVLFFSSSQVYTNIILHPGQPVEEVLACKRVRNVGRRYLQDCIVSFFKFFYLFAGDCQLVPAPADPACVPPRQPPESV